VDGTTSVTVVQIDRQLQYDNSLKSLRDVILWRNMLDLRRQIYAERVAERGALRDPFAERCLAELRSIHSDID
jgi:hypothetical protein